MDERSTARPPSPRCAAASSSVVARGIRFNMSGLGGGAAPSGPGVDGPSVLTLGDRADHSWVWQLREDPDAPKHDPNKSSRQVFSGHYVRVAPTHAAVACFDDDDDGAGARPRRGPRPRAADGDAAAALARRREGRRDDDRDGRARRRRRRVHRPPREANSDVDDDTSRRLDEVSLTR